MKEQDFVREGLSEDELKRMDGGEPPPADAGDDADQQQPPLEGGDADGRARDEHGRFVKKEGEGDGVETKTVDLRALQEARAEARELRDKYSRLEERTNLILGHLDSQKQAAEKKPEAAEPPDPEHNIFAAVKYERERRLELEKQLSERTQVETQTREQRESEDAAFAYLNQSLEAAKSSAPDIDDASNWLYDFRLAQLKVQGFNELAAKKVIRQEVYQGIVHAYQNGMDPAEYFYRYANASGYQKKLDQPGQQPPAQQQQQRPDGNAAIREQAERQSRHMSLSSVQGGEPPKGIDAKALASMSDADFQKLMSTAAGRAQIEAAMGVQ